LMAAYNLVLFIMIQEKSYAYLVFFLGSVLLFQLLRDGYPQMIFPSRSFRLSNNGQATVFALTQVSELLFVSAYLNTRLRAPKLHRCLLVLVAFNVVAAVSCSIFPTRLFVKPLYLLGQVNQSVLFIIGLVLCLKRYRPACFFLSAWISLIIGSSLFFLVRARLIEHSELTENGYRLGMIPAVLLLSLGVADRIILLKREREAAQEEALDRGAAKRAAEEAHSLKGAAGTIGATALFKLAGELHYALDKGGIGLAPVLVELERELDRVLADIETLAEWNGEGGTGACTQPAEALQADSEGCS